MKKINFLFILSISFLISSCTILMGEKTKEDAFKTANNKAKKIGLKVGSSCKYFGFIGDNSVAKATSNGKIKFKMFSVEVGGFIKNCTYSYGK